MNANGNVLSEIPGGTYTVEITDNNSLCTSTLEIVVNDVLTDVPTVNNAGTTVSEVTVCEGNDDYPNGGVSVTSVSGGSGNYSYEWYFGTTVNAANSIANGDDIFARKGIAGTIGINGNVSITTGGSTIVGLNEGTYTLRVVDTQTGCTSAIENYTITNLVPAIVGNINKTSDDYSCDVSTPTGRLVVSTTPAIGYSFEWYSGNSAAGSIIATTAALENRTAGNYTVKIIDNTTSCFIALTETIERNTPDLVLSLDGAITAQTNCNPANGEVTVQVNIPLFTGTTPQGFTENITYEWYSGQTVNPSNLLGETSTTLSNLVAGFYTVVATENSSGCVSVPFTVEIPDATIANTPIITQSLDIIPSSCDAINGEISGSISLANNPSGNDFDFEWYEGSENYADNPGSGTPLTDGGSLIADPSASLTITGTSTTGGAGSSSLSGLVSGLYTLVAEDQSTGCRYQQVFDLPFNGIQATATITIDHVTECPDNGTATVSLADESDFDYGTLVGDFEIGDIITGSTSGATGTVNFDNDVNQLSASISSGNFQIGETITGSVSGATASIINITNSGFNDGDVDDISEYEIYLYAGAGVPADRFTPVTVNGFTSPTIIVPPAGIAPGGSVTFTGLPAGVYTAIAREKVTAAFAGGSSSQCFSLAATDEIDQRAYEPIVDGFTIVDNTVCDETIFGGNGSITVNARLDNEDVFVRGQFKFRWFAGTDTTTNPAVLLQTPSSTTSSLTGLDPGQYTVSIGRLGNPEDALAVTNISGEFDSGEEVTGSVSGASATFDRYIDDTQDTVYIYTVTGNFVDTDVITGTVSGATADVIAGGVVESGSARNGCVILSSFNVQDIPEVHEIIDAFVQNQTDCSPNNAFIEIRDIDITDNSGDYTYTWYDGDLTTVIAGETNSTLALTSLGAGTYFVEAENNNNGCVTAPFQVDVLDNTIDPQVTLSVNNIDTSCDPDPNEGNGSISLTIGSPDLNTNYAYQWYVGTSTGGTSLSDNGTITGATNTLNGPNLSDYVATLSGIQGNENYTVEITDLSNPNAACKVVATIFLNETINSKTLRPTIDYSISDNQNCTNPNGSVLIQSVFEEGAAQPVANYSFQWFDPSAADITGSANNVGTGTANQLTDLVGGTYQVLITNNLTQCVSDNRINIEIGDVQENPVVQVASTSDDTFCTGTTTGDGALTIEVTEAGVVINPADYTVNWFRGDDITDPALAAPAVIGGTYNNILTGLSAGQYTVQITKSGAVAPNAGCEIISTFTIGSDQPVLTINQTSDLISDDNFNCTNPNGFIEITQVREDGVPVAVVGANYSFAWTDGTATPVAAVAGTSAIGTNNRIEGLEGDTYTVVITNTTTQCVTTAPITITIDDRQVNPVVNSSVLVDDSFCDNTGNAGDGQLSIEIFENGAATASDPNDFTVTWYRGNTTINLLSANLGTAVIGGTNNTELTGLSAGQYTVEIVKGAITPNAGCQQTVTFTIGSDQPVLTLVPSVNFSTQDNQNCTNQNGFIEITSVQEDGVSIPLTNVPNYTFTWTNSAGNPVASVNAGTGIDNRIEDLTGDTYTVVATNDITGCQTAEVDITINDVQVDPVVVLNSLVADSFCDNGPSPGPNDFNGDGSIDITVEEAGVAANLANYTITWYRGDDNTDPVLNNGDGTVAINASATQLTGLSTGQYTVEITKNATAPNAGCTVTTTYTVGSDQPVLTIDPTLGVSKSDNQNCVNPNGQITITSIKEDDTDVAVNLTNYTFVWTDNLSNPVTAVNAGGTGNRIEDLTGGPYNVIATNVTTGCATATVVTIIDDVQENPVVQVASTSDDTFCTGNTTGDGALQISITENGIAANTADYSIVWFRGAGTTDQIFPVDGGTRGSANALTADRTSLDGLSADTYTVVITKDASIAPNAGCSVTSSFTIGSDQPVLSIDQTLDVIGSDNQNCINPNGSVVINNVRENGIVQGLANYTFSWTDSFGTPIAGVDNGGVGNSITQLTGGTYTVIATNTITQCISASVDITIDDVQEDPVVQVVSTSDDTFCTGTTTGDGTLEITVTEAGVAINPADYTVNWFRGDDITDPALVAPAVISGPYNNILSNLSAGQYTVQITKNGAVFPNAGCETISTFTIGLDQPILTIDQSLDISFDHNSNCTNPSGSIIVNNVREDGIAQTLTNYTFVWTSVSGNPFTVADIGGTGNSIQNLTGGTYTVTATNTNTQCVSDPVFISIDDLQQDPVINASLIKSDEFCDNTGDTGDGAITIEIFENGAATASDPNDFAVTWYRGNTTTTLLTTSLGSAVIGGTNNTELTGLSTGFYTVEIVKGATGSNQGCESTATFEVGKNEPVLTIDLAAGVLSDDNQNCDNPNGFVEITEVVENGITFAVNATNYTFQWFDESNVEITASAIIGTTVAGNGNRIENLTGGNYTVVANNVVTGCSTGTVITIIDDTQINPIIEIATISDDTYCDNGAGGLTGDGTASLNIIENGTAATIADYNFIWYRGNSTDPNNEIYPNNPTGLRGSAIQLADNQMTGLSVGEYTVMIEKDPSISPNAGCESVTTFTIGSDQPELTIDAITEIKGNENCVNPDGFIEVSAVSENGVSNPVNLTNYTFEWFDEAGNNLTTAAVNGLVSVGTGNRLENLEAGTYTIVANNTVTGCTSVEFEVDVEDLRESPQIFDIILVDNTNCSVNKNGSVTVSAETGGSVSTYTFEWFDGTGTATIGNPANVVTGVGGLNANQSRYENLSDGDYTVRVTDDVTGCTVEGTFTIGEELTIPTLTVQQANITADTLCFPGIFSGGIIITDADVSTGDLTDFDITIERDSVNSGDVIGIFNATPNTQISVTGLESGEYWITASLVSTGCSAASFRVNIEELSRNPEIELISITNNIDCGGGIEAGAISILADGQTSANADYGFQWYVGTSVVAGQEADIIYPGSTGATTETLANVPGGQYTVSISRTSTGCATDQIFEILTDEILPVIENVEVNNQTTCFENGSIVILNVSYNGADVDSLTLVDDYTIEWFSDPALTTVVTDPDASTPLQLDSLGMGTYYLRVTKDNDGCSSTVAQFDIENNSFLPEIFITQVAADSTCNGGGIPNGILVATADGRTSANPDYSFTWYLESDYPANPIVNSDSLIGFSAGDYLVEVSNSATGCSTTAVSRIDNVQITPQILAAVATSPSACVPLNGSIEVTQVSNGNVSDYTFVFYDSDPSANPAPIQNSASATLFGIAEGTYFIQGFSVNTGCETGFYQITVEDGAITLPEIELVSFEQQRNCDPSNPNGSLTVSANGSQDPALFSFDWFDANGIQIETNNPTADSLMAFVDYRVVVTDLITGCTSEETFQVGEDKPVPLSVNVTSSPNFNCLNPNGSVGVSVIQARRSVGDYTYLWFIGRQSNPDLTTPDYEGRIITNLDAGEYTVFVVDNVDSFCESTPAFITVDDETMRPELEFEIEQALTNCDPTIPNGRISVSSPSGDISTYRFDWYVGTDTVGQTPFFTGITADSLEASSYTVVITDLVTGCENIGSEILPNEQEPVNAPGIAVVGNNTSCVSPNGSARASVSGNTTDYFFEWFSKDAPNTVIGTGSLITGLTEGVYEVRATEIATGCVSDRSEIAITLEFTAPVFEVETISNNCIRTEDGGANQFSGIATIRFSINVSIDSIAWLENGTTLVADASNNFAWTDAPPGDHIVRIFTTDRCDFYDQSFTIDTDIVVYNGVSDNEDTKNDYFLIDCIEFFPNNRVEIFDRGGQKVYEINGYNNIDKRFDGVANTGATLGSSRLPEGTYYYIIDKGDGTRPLQGFLELVR
ncbi:MAG: gliding motility-associated C-terminal domain-containing protein [Cyclobacteriaceae bacterium]